MLCFIILCIEEISKIYAFFHNRLPIGFDIYDSLVTVEKKTINEFCVIHIALLLILLWSVFIIANNLFHTPNIQFDREGCLINSKKEEESILFRAGFLLIINATFIGVMGYILYIVYHILNIDIYAPITFLILFIVIDIFAVSVMKNKKNISFVSRVLEFLPTFPTSFHRIKDKRIPEENIVSGSFIKVLPYAKDHSSQSNMTIASFSRWPHSARRMESNFFAQRKGYKQPFSLHQNHAPAVYPHFPQLRIVPYRKWLNQNLAMPTFVVIFAQEL